MVKIKWDVEELIALISIFDQVKSGELHDLDEKLEKLSNTLNYRANVLGIPHDEKFRNINGVKMMYQNLIYVASQGTQGLSSASQAMYDVYEMHQKCPAVSRMILEEFIRRYCPDSLNI